MTSGPSASGCACPVDCDDRSMDGRSRRVARAEQGRVPPPAGDRRTSAGSPSRRRALPMILPVHFALDGDRIVVTTWDGSILSRATRRRRRRLRGRRAGRLGHPSWSVLVNGVADHAGEVACAERGSAWVPDRTACVISISTDHVSGRQTPDHWQDVRPWSARVAGRTLGRMTTDHLGSTVLSTHECSGPAAHD